LRPPDAARGPATICIALELVARAPACTAYRGRVEPLDPTRSLHRRGQRPTAAPGSFRSPCLRGLPDTGVYVAWVTTPQMDSVIKLGPRQERRRLRSPVIALEKFNFLVTVERSTRRPRTNGPGGAQRPVAQHAAVSRRTCSSSSIGAMRQGSVEQHEHMAMGWPMVPTPPGRDDAAGGDWRCGPRSRPICPATDSAIPARAAARGDPRRERRHGAAGAPAVVRRVINGRSYTMFGYNGEYPGPDHRSAARRRALRALHERAGRSPPASIGTAFGSPIPSDGVDAVGGRWGGSFTYRGQGGPMPGSTGTTPHQTRRTSSRSSGLYGNLLVRRGLRRGESRSNPHARTICSSPPTIRPLIPPRQGIADARPHGGAFGNLFLVNGEPRLSLGT